MLVKDPKAKEMIGEAIDKIYEDTNKSEFNSLFNYFNVASKFYRYSNNNILLISLQKPEATRVADFDKWNSLGYAIKKGEKGIKILAPEKDKTGQNKDKEADEDNIRFSLKTVFDISQCEGMKNDFKKNALDLGLDDKSKYLKLKTIIENTGTTVKEHKKNIPEGILNKGQIDISYSKDYSKNLRDLVNKYSSAILRETDNKKPNSQELKNYKVEAIGAIVGRAIGEDIKFNSDFCPEFYGTKDDLKTNLAKVSRVSGMILKKIDNDLFKGKAQKAEKEIEEVFKKKEKSKVGHDR